MKWSTSGRWLCTTGAAAALLFSACAGPAGTSAPSAEATAATGSSAAPSSVGPVGSPQVQGNLTVWTDSIRQPLFEAYATAHPGVNLNIQVADGSTYLSKIVLANNANSGWPDVVFSTDPSQATTFASPLYGFAADLTTVVPADVVANFGKTLTPCAFGGKLYCLRNDAAPTVLWYNKKLMDQFGYTLPTTYAEYEALGLKVAQEHPGYLVGSAGDSDVMWEWMWASGCPFNDVTAPSVVHINLKDPRCTRVADLLDPLIKAGSVTRASYYDAGFAKDADKILMSIEAPWFGTSLFRDTYKLPDGLIAAAPMPTWSGDPVNYSAENGGGIYTVSSHTTNMPAAVDLALWVSTNPDAQKLDAGYSAYGPAEKAKDQQWASSFFAANPAPVFADAATKIRQDWKFVAYPVDSIWTQTVAQAVRSGGTIADSLSAFETQCIQLAQIAGYSVTNP